MTEDNAKEVLYLQTDYVSVTIKGSSSHPSFPGVEFTEKESKLVIACDDPFEAYPSGDAELVSLQNIGRRSVGEYCMRPIFFEQQRYEILIEPEEGHTVEFWHDNYNIRKNITSVGRKSKMLSGVINFRNEIGLSDLVIIVDGIHHHKITLEVFPSKISYKEDYKAIVADVTAEVYNLVFDFLKKTYESFDISSDRRSSPVEFFAIIQKIYDEFMVAADMVLAKPHHLLTKEYEVLPMHKVKRTDNRSIRWMEKHPDHVQRRGDRFVADKALAVKKYVTYDTKENRLTKYMLQSTVKRLESFKMQYSRLSRDIDESVMDKLDKMIQGIQRRCNTGFLREVEATPAKSGMSLVFGMAPGYRDVYRCYLLLQHGLSVTGNIFNISQKDIAVLYEYWCFIKLNSLMKERYELLSQDIIKISGNGLFVSLIKGQRSRVRYKNPANGEIITLSYNPKEISGATVPQKPDNVLSLKKNGANVNYEYVFDAKYKMNPALEGSMYQRMYGNPGPQEEDINTMHRYRDAIVYQQQKDISPYERTMFGAYVLFPYRNEEEYKSHRFYRSIDQVNIGGLPFLPSATDLVTNLLDELITDSPESAFERATLPAGIEDKLSVVNWNKRDVLIGSFRSREHFEFCFDKKIYYVPEERIKEKNLPVHYIAMYQKPRIFSKDPGIYYYGEVLRTTRKHGKNIGGVIGKNDDDRLYYCFEVREWKALSKPILPRESDFLHEYTNLFLLKNVEYVPELLLRSEEEYRFYMELKRRTGIALENNTDDTSGFEIGDTKVLFDDGQIQVFKFGKEAGKCTVGEFSRHPNAMFRRLQWYAEKIKNQ